MKSSNEIRELEKLSKGLAPKSGCQVCRLVLVAAVILFVSSLLLAAFALGKARPSASQVDKPRVLSAAQSTERLRNLRAEVLSQQGSSTIIIGKPKTK